jgi:tRNA(Ile)-lysidine synthase
MLHVLASLRGEARFVLSAHGVDHGLREEAARELELAAELARSLDVPFTTTTLAVKPGSNLQARARSARYAALRAAASAVGASLVATAHTADDRAETVLMRILRGAGPRGLAVLPPLSGDLLRPLIRASRADIEKHLARNRIASATDPTNLDARYLRVRVRREVMPLLASMSRGVVASLTGLADALAAWPADDPLSGLGRRQRETALRALAAGKRSVRIRTAEHEEVLVEPSAGGPVVTEVEAQPPRRR